MQTHPQSLCENNNNNNNNQTYEMEPPMPVYCEYPGINNNNNNNNNNNMGVTMSDPMLSDINSIHNHRRNESIISHFSTFSYANNDLSQSCIPEHIPQITQLQQMANCNQTTQINSNVNLGMFNHHKRGHSLQSVENNKDSIKNNAEIGSFYNIDREYHNQTNLKPNSLRYLCQFLSIFVLRVFLVLVLIFCVCVLSGFYMHTYEYINIVSVTKKDQYLLFRHCLMEMTKITKNMSKNIAMFQTINKNA